MQTQARSGAEFLRAILRGDVPPPPMALLMNIRLVEVDEGRVAFTGEPGEQHYNPLGTVHGGWTMTILDSALGCAVQTLLPPGVGYTTTDTQVRIVRALTKDTGPVRCEATAVHVGRSTGVAEGRLLDGAGRLLAVGTTGCAILTPS